MNRIDELLQQRASIDAELCLLKEEAEKELQAAADRISQLNAALGKPVKIEPIRANRTEIDETDAGNGIAEQRQEANAASFLDDLNEMRQRTLDKRRRRA